MYAYSIATTLQQLLLQLCEYLLIYGIITFCHYSIILLLCDREGSNGAARRINRNYCEIRSREREIERERVDPGQIMFI